MASIPIITLDGPSGAGKGTLGVRLASRLRWHYLDSGALYRIVAHHADDALIEARDWDAVMAKLGEARVHFDVSSAAGAYRIILNDEDITDAIRTVACGQKASKIAADEALREHLVEWQRGFCQPPGLVTDGRDMGTVIFPKAPYKFFIDASCEERAKRRLLQYQAAGLLVDFDSLLAELKQRDQRDRERKASPCVPAPDAIVVDTTLMDADAVLAYVLDRVHPS